MQKEEKTQKSPGETQAGSAVENKPAIETIPKKKFRKILGNYSYNQQHLIGWGYTSKVYKGKHNSSSSDYVAIKKISITDLDDLHSDLLRNQTKIVKRLKHPNVVNCFDVLFTKKNCYIVMEYCEGGSLENHLPTIESLDEKIKIISDVCDGFKYLANVGIVHRDIKPGNILRNGNGTWKIADFGFAADIAKAINDNNISVGTPLYMAPQSLKSRRYSYQSDIFGLGIVIYQIINNGRLLWAGKNKKIILEAIISFNLESVQLPPQFNTKFLKKMLELKPQNRPQPQKIGIQNLLSKQYRNPEQSINDGKDHPNQQIIYENILETEQLLRMGNLLSTIIESNTLSNLAICGNDLQSAAMIQLCVLVMALDNLKDHAVTALYYSKKYRRRIQKYKDIIKINSITSDPKTKAFCQQTLQLIKEVIQQLPEENVQTSESFYSKNSNVSQNLSPTFSNFYKNGPSLTSMFSVTPKPQFSKAIFQEFQTLKQILKSYQQIIQQILNHNCEPTFFKRITSEKTINHSASTNGVRIY